MKFYELKAMERCILQGNGALHSPGKVSESSMKYMVTLEIDPKGSGKTPDEWFWTDACPSPEDEVTLIEVAEVEE